MTVHFTVGVYSAKVNGDERWTALTPVAYGAWAMGAAEPKLRDQMIERLRDALRRAPPAMQDQFQLPIGTELVRVPVDVKLGEARATGNVPLVVEPRWVGRERQVFVVFHPHLRWEWFLAESRDDIAGLVPAFLRKHWSTMSQDAATRFLSNGKDRLVTVAFSCEPMSLIDQLPSRKAASRTGAGVWRPDRVLYALGVDETKAMASAAPEGVPRSPYRERLQYLLGGPRPRSVAVIGPAGSGKTTLLRQWVADRLAEDGYALHKNLDRVHHVWRISGKRLIAGMSYLGQWEERCLSVLDDARKHRGILWVEDLHLWGRLGQSRQSERSFADFFRGPVRRGDVALVAELTPEQLARLERDAPALAEALARVVVPAASAEETAALLLHEVRALEVRLPVAMHPFVPRTALELGAALFPWRARPGVAVEIVRRVADAGAAEGTVTEPRELTPHDVLAYLARSTGLSTQLIALDEPLDPATVEAAFAARVIGQPVATRAAADVIVRVRAGLADPGRPVNVLLFTGPTGTGKTELATAIAEYLYGGGDRLLRVDMGELSGPDAVARLIGDRWNPDGLLTSRVRAQPFCVVLLDEIEKAHPHALHLLLQLFDEGRLTDAAGDVASFASAVVIMTSNLGSKSASPIGFGETRDRILADVAKAVREFFPVELFNRIDRVVPFEPLTPEVAAAVVDKELAKLLARRGLRERNTFVYAGAAIRRRAVADAFDPRYGARTVKRWLEDAIGGALTDLLATAPPARLRIVRLSEHAGAIQASLEPMAERVAAAGPYLLEGALDLATAALEPVVAQAVAALDRVAAAPMYEMATRGATGELAFFADELVHRVAALRELFGVRAAGGGVGDIGRAPLRGGRRDDGPDGPDGPDEHDEHDDGSDYGETLRDTAAGIRVVRTRTRAPGQKRRSIANRDALVAGIAEALLVERALPTLLDADAHAVTVVVSRGGTTADAHGLGIVVDALAQPGWLDGAASADAAGRVKPLAAAPHRGGSLAPRVPPRLAVPADAREVAFVLRGLFVREALAGEHGTWMIRAQASEPDVVRVEVRPGAPAEAAAVLRAHLAGRAELERVLEQGGPLPPNPDVLLPVTRTLAYRRPLREGESFTVELEDFSTGWVDRSATRDLTTAIRRVWHLAWSRRPAGTT